MLQKDTYGRRRIHEFLEELGKEVPPLPAGGCAVALAGALSVALELFVTRLTVKKKSPESTDSLTEILPRLQDLQKKCLKMMDRDVQLYERLMQALTMPTSTQEEKAGRKAALREAKVGVLGPPLALAEWALEMLRYSHRLIEEVYQVALADAGVAAEMAHACLWGALWIARANLQWIYDGGELVEQKTKLLDGLEIEGEGVYRKIVEELERSLSHPNQP